MSDYSALRKDPAKRPRNKGSHSLSTPVRFLMLSDTHGTDLPQNLPPCDVLLHCGDLTEDGTPESISSALQNLGKVEARLKLVIAGNHEISLDKRYWLSQGGSEASSDRAHALISSDASSEASQNGITFLFEGTYTFNLPCGATFNIYASPYTPGFGTSAFQYTSSEDRFNHADTTPSWATNVGTALSIIPENVDIVMTHGPPKYILDETDNGDSAGCEHLRRAIARVQPRLHCFGHIHLPREGWKYEAHRLEYGVQNELDGDSEPIRNILKDWVGTNSAHKKRFRCLTPGAAEDFRENRQQTLCVNAAMEGEEGVLEHPPWLVTLDLPVWRIKMTVSSSLVLYSPGSSTTMTGRSSASSLISSRLFSQQTGTAIATELLYRILIDIINRFLSSFQRLAARGMDSASTWMERKMQERRDRLDAAKAGAGEGLGIVEEVVKLSEERGFVTCPMTGRVMDMGVEEARRPPGPPQWIQGVLRGIDEGRMSERDIWIQTHGD
ncbi:Metallo-dependent phosphatase [Stemphylium lycopersici]|nr:ser thr protein phosphatase family protein [Stemphylium lycopersici]RAR11013.1 Metallo-dependent phosphatase [Stemphylium lycopersici]